MKARVKATGEIVDVEKTILRGGECYMNITGEKIGSLYMKYELDFGFDCDYNPDYWTRLEHQYAGMAMNALLLTNNIRNGDLEGMRECNTNAMAIAHALVEKLKEKEE